MDSPSGTDVTFAKDGITFAKFWDLFALVGVLVLVLSFKVYLYKLAG